MKTKDGVESSGESDRIVKSTYPNFFVCEIARLRKRLAASVLLGALLLGCPPATETITVTNNGSSPSVSGTGFSNLPFCANLAFTGLQEVVSMGYPNCSGGGFSNFNWRFAAITAPGSTQQCQFTGPQDAVVTATDETSSEIASQKISITWGPNCALICGVANEPACPAGCLEGQNLTGERNGICCGGPGTIPCGDKCCRKWIESCGFSGGVSSCNVI
jgi:hypothetical protein